MSGRKSSISKASSYEEIGEFWDKQDVSTFWEETAPVTFTIDIQRESTYYRLDASLASRIHSLANMRGVSPETLLNLLVQEKLAETP